MARPGEAEKRVGDGDRLQLARRAVAEGVHEDPRRGHIHAPPAVLAVDAVEAAGQRQEQGAVGADGERRRLSGAELRKLLQPGIERLHRAERREQRAGGKTDWRRRTGAEEQDREGGSHPRTIARRTWIGCGRWKPKRKPFWFSFSLLVLVGRSRCSFSSVVLVGRSRRSLTPL